MCGPTRSNDVMGKPQMGFVTTFTVYCHGCNLDNKELEALVPLPWFINHYHMGYHPIRSLAHLHTYDSAVSYTSLCLGRLYITA